MQFSTLTTLALLFAPLVRADANAQVVEFQAILSDVNSHLTDYISLAVNNPSFTLPDGVLDVYTQMTTYTDDSFTTLFTELDFNSINAVMTALPWYSNRLEPCIQSAFKANSITDTAIGAVVTDSASSSQSSEEALTTSSSSQSSATSTKKYSTVTTMSFSASFPPSSSVDKSSSSTSSATSSSASTSSQSAAANFNELNPVLGAAFLGSVAMLL